MNTNAVLSQREREILKLIATSHSSPDIAKRLGITAKTADTHRTNMMRKLDIHDISGLTRYALAIGVADNEFIPR